MNTPQPLRLPTVMLAVIAVSVACGNRSKLPTYDPVPSGGPSAEAPWWEQPALTVDDSEPALSHESIWVETEIPAQILFAYDSAELSPEGRRALVTAHRIARLSTARAITIAGATDSSGSLDYNLRLSERRAHAALEVLAELGVDPSIVTIEAWADNHPPPTNPDVDLEESGARQRRVEIQALLPEDFGSRLVASGSIELTTDGELRWRPKEDEDDRHDQR